MRAARGKTRAAILEEAMKLFARDGYAGAGMAELARRVGVRKASLYAHYRGKKEIFRGVFTQVLEGYSAHLGRIESAADPGASLRDRLAAIFSSYASYFSNADAMGFWYRAYMTPPAFMKGEIYRKSLAVELRFLRRLTRLFREAMAAKECRKQNAGHVATAFYQLLMGFGMAAAFYPSMNTQRAIRESVSVFWRGVGPG
jgi:AcrR family transcriptional regulator